MGKKQKKEKQPSNSDKVVAYLRTTWQSGEWGLDDIAQHLFTDFDTVPGSVRDAYRRSTMHAFNGARGKLCDIHRELVIPAAFYRGKTVAWCFATGSDEHRERIEKLLKRKESAAKGFATSFDKAVKLVAERGWLGHQAQLAN